MVKLLKFLLKVRWLFLFPLASLFIWLFGFLSSSVNRFIPWVFSNLLSFFTENFQSMTGYSQMLTFMNVIGEFVVGLNAWIPVYDMLTVFFMFIAWRLSYFATRVFIKAVTVGQV